VKEELVAMQTQAAGDRRADGEQATVSRRAFVQAGAAGVLTAASWQRVLGANERIGVGFIGYGLIGKRHVLDFKAQSDVDMVGLAEVHRARKEEGLAELGRGARGFSDFRRLLEQRDVQAVVISTPDHWHALQTMMACAAGKDVYVEKPLTLFVREGRWMIEAARRHRRVVQVGTQQRSGAHFQRARELIQAGRLGTVHSVRMMAFRNVMPGFGQPADSDPPRELDWDQWLGPAPERRYNRGRCLYHFRWFWDYSGGQMTNLGTHALDMAHWVLGLPGPRGVSAAGGRYCLQDNGETPDTQDVLFEYPRLTAVWSHREACAGVRSRFHLEFHGTNGSLAITRTGFVVTPDALVPPENILPRFAGAHPAGGPEAVQTAGPSSPRTAAVEDRSGSAADQFRQHVRNFLDCVKSRRTPISDLESAQRVANACHLANLSLRLGRKLRWDSEREEAAGDVEANRLLVRSYRAPWDRELRALGIGGAP
jgi:predicted dehydrogenase